MFEDQELPEERFTSKFVILIKDLWVHVQYTLLVPYV